MFIVSPPGIHISLGICVWGYTYHGDTHITVTPACRSRAFPTAERDGFNRAAIHVLCFVFISS